MTVPGSQFPVARPVKTEEGRPETSRHSARDWKLETGNQKPGYVLEIFSTFQGEGPYVGAPQVFVRLGGCHLRCDYCDTPESWTRSADCAVEETPMQQDFRTETNPMSVARVVEIVQSHSLRRPVHSVSITGGEPLLQTPFLRSLLPELKRRGLTTYLDTSGTLSNRLEEIIDSLDIVALDWKLPSCPGVKMDPEDARRCVLLASRKSCFVKIVLLQDSRIDEVEQAARTIAQINPAIPLILQPATPINERIAAPSPEHLTLLSSTARTHLRDVRVLPQVHPLMAWK